MKTIPYLIRHICVAFGRKGEEEGREEGREEGLLVARRRSIVDVLALRFAPPALVVQQVAQYVETLTDEAALERLFAAAIRSTSLAEFQAAMTQG